MMNNNYIGVGVVGCGRISDIYLQNMIGRHENLNVICCCAAHPENAHKKALKYGISACSFEEMLENRDIGIVVILTPAYTHYQLIYKALCAGKHVYTEKVMALNTEHARALVHLAAEKGLYLSSAPDTFLGASMQTALRAIREGKIGTVTGFSISCNRNLDYVTSKFDFLNQPGGGIDFDYGVYYITQLVAMLGPVDSVCAFEANSAPKRVNCCPENPRYGMTFDSPNIGQISAVLKMKSGITGTFTLDGESLSVDLACFLIYGTKGILRLGDANRFGGEVHCLTVDDENTLHDERLNYGLKYGDNSRGLGPAEMAEAIANREKSRTDAALALHVVDILGKMAKSASTGKVEYAETSCEIPEMF